MRWSATSTRRGGTVSSWEFDCEDLVEVVTDYLDDAMALPDRLRFEQHLLLCEGCSTFLEQLRTTIRLTGRLSAETVPPDARTALLAAFRDWKRR